jgi:hypothetical protein
MIPISEEGGAYLLMNDNAARVKVQFKSGQNRTDDSDVLCVLAPSLCNIHVNDIVSDVGVICNSNSSI